jgi:hypothetical protein
LSETLVLSRSPCFRFIFSTLWDLKLIVVLRYVFFFRFLYYVQRRLVLAATVVSRRSLD